MNEHTLADFVQELPLFKEMTEKFYTKEITKNEYKGFSGKYGSYAQRDGEHSMLRLRLGGGRITKETLKFIVESIERYHIDKIHFTTCQTIQLHNLKASATCEIMEQAISHGIYTWGGGGDFPRNVMVSPLSGVEQGEYFDVMPYAMAAADYLMGVIGKIKLPRKLKVGFSNSPANLTHATFRDLGFAATERGTFDVYSAGGLGSNPRMGVCVAENVEPNQILFYIKAMIETFVAHGNYENRAKARTRYMQESLGVEGYVSAYRTSLAAVIESGESLSLSVGEKINIKSGDGTTTAGFRVVEQKQEGLYAVAYHPIGGSPDPIQLRRIYDVISDMDQAELRLTPEEGLYIINCTGKEAKRVLEMTQDSAGNLFETSVACIGAAVCQIGVRDSQELLQSLVEETRACGFADGVLPQLHISGCPSSCGTHQIGVIGFHGGVKIIDKAPIPAFTLHLGGSQEEGEARFGEAAGTILQKDIPAFLIELGKTVEKAGQVFESWYPEHMDELKGIAKAYLC